MTFVWQVISLQLLKSRTRCSSEIRTCFSSSHHLFWKKWECEINILRNIIIMLTLKSRTTPPPEIRAYTPGSSHLSGQLKEGKICFWMAISIFQPSTRGRLPAEGRFMININQDGILNSKFHWDFSLKWIKKKTKKRIKSKKEQQRYAEEQRLLRRNFQEEPYPGEMSEMLAKLRLEEVKEAREKQQRREREHQRYLEALRVQIREKMQLYNITLPPLCGCGPDFWDAHPNTCANNCIFYKNHRELQLNYTTTIILNHPKSSWMEVLQLQINEVRKEGWSHEKAGLITQVGE